MDQEGARQPLTGEARLAAYLDAIAGVLGHAGRAASAQAGDEARIGQKNKITRRWAKRGTRPSAPRDQRTASAYIFGAICPREGKSLPRRRP